jgi:DNA-binding MarR family transcriptional regulator
MSNAVAAPVRWLTPTEERAWRGYRRMRTLLDLQLARDLARDSGLSEPDFDVLSTLTEREDARWRAGDLAERLLWSTSRLTHHVKRMEGRGLVRRQPCDDDGRGAVLTLTDGGWSTLKAAAPLHVRSVRKQFIDLLTAEEIDCLAGISEKVSRCLADTR